MSGAMSSRVANGSGSRLRTKEKSGEIISAGGCRLLVAALFWCCGGLPSAGAAGGCRLLCVLSAGDAGGCRLLAAAVCWCCGGLPSAGGCCLLVLWGLSVCWCLLFAAGVCRLLVLRGVAVCWWLLSAGAVGGAAEGRSWLFFEM